MEARLDFDDEMPPLYSNMLIDKMNGMWHDVQQSLDTANYDKLLQSGLQRQANSFFAPRKLSQD